LKRIGPESENEPGEDGLKKKGGCVSIGRTGRPPKLRNGTRNSNDDTKQKRKI